MIQGIQSSIQGIQSSIQGATAGRCLVPPIGLPSAIAGHGSRSIALAAADPLEVNAVLFEAGARRCLLLSFDLLYISGTLRRDLLLELSTRYGLADADIFMFASHTHFAPPTDSSLPDLGSYDEAYAIRVREAVLGLVGDLVAGVRVPVRLEIRRGRLAHSVNRRRPRLAPSYTRTWVSRSRESRSRRMRADFATTWRRLLPLRMSRHSKRWQFYGITRVIPWRMCRAG